MNNSIEIEVRLETRTPNWGQDDPVVTAITPAHQAPPPGAGLYDWALNSFSQSELSELSEDSSVDLIVHHGQGSAPMDFSRRYGHRELIQPHAAAGAVGAQIDREQLKKILTGEVVNWRDVGGENVPISLYVHGAELNFRAFQWQLEENGYVIDVPLKRKADYEALASAAKTDRGALVFGLRSEVQFSEWLIGLPVCEAVFQPRTISVFMRSSSKTAPIVAEKFLRTVYERLKEDRLVSIEFPTWDAKRH